MLRVDGIHIYYLNPFSSSIWNISEILAGVSVTLWADDTLGNLFGSCRWEMNLSTGKKSETRGQKFIQVFPGNEKT